MIILKISISIVGVLASVIGFILFTYFCNYPAATWALLTGIAATVTLHLHWLSLRKVIQDWYTSEQLQKISCLGFWMFTIGIMGFVYHLVFFIMLRTPILPIRDSEVIRLVWAFLEFKSGLILLLYSKSYANKLNNCDNTLLITSSGNE